MSPPGRSAYVSVMNRHSLGLMRARRVVRALVCSWTLACTGCGGSDRETASAIVSADAIPSATAPPTSSSWVVPPKTPLKGATYLGTVERTARFWQQRNGVGNAFPSVLTALPQVMVSRPEPSVCRFSARGRSVRCATTPGARAPDLAAHQSDSRWTALGRTHDANGEVIVNAFDPVTRKTLLSQPSSGFVGASTDIGGYTRMLALRRMSRFGPSGALLDTFELPVAAADGALVGPWIVSRDATRLVARYVHPVGPQTLGEVRDLGPGELAEPLHACWGHGHTVIWLPSGTTRLPDDPTQPVTRLSSEAHEPPAARERRPEVVCTEDGAIISRSDEQSTGDRLVEERCSAKGCTVQRSAPRPAGSPATVSAPLGERTLVVTVEGNNVDLRIGSLETIETAPKRALVEQSTWDTVLVDAMVVDEAVLVFAFLGNRPRLAAVPGPSTKLHTFVFRVDMDGRVEPIPLLE